MGLPNEPVPTRTKDNTAIEEGTKRAKNNGERLYPSPTTSTGVTMMMRSANSISFIRRKTTGTAWARSTSKRLTTFLMTSSNGMTRSSSRRTSQTSWQEMHPSVEQEIQLPRAARHQACLAETTRSAGGTIRWALKLITSRALAR